MHHELDRTYRWFKIRLTDEDRKPRDYYFRGLTANELRIAGTKPDEESAENYVLETVVLGNTDWKSFPYPGVPLRLMEEINHVSGLTEAGIPQEAAVQWILSERGGMEALAVSMIPGLSLKQLRNADVFDYWQYIIIGKHMFESLYAKRAESTFQPVEGGTPDNPFTMNLPPDASALAQINPQSPKGVLNEGGFHWSRSGR